MWEEGHIYKFYNLQHVDLWKAYFVERHILRNTLDIALQTVKDIKFTFLMSRIMKSKELKNIWGTSSFFTEPISFLVFSTVRRYITHFHNNEYIIISSLTSGVTDMSICFFKRRSIKIIRLKKEIVLSVFHYFFDLSIYIGGSSNQLMEILLSFFLF